MPETETIQTYPILKFPFSIRPYFKGTIPELDQTISEPKKERTQHLRFSTIVIGVIGFALSIYVFDNSVVVSILGCLFSILMICVFIGDLQTFKQEKRKIEASYLKALKQYKEDVESQRRLKQRLITETQKREFIQRRIIEIARSSTSILPIDISLSRKGKAEFYFLKILREVFGKAIKIDCGIIEDNWNYTYMPDFVFDDGNLRIDIEIDEPYISDSHTPIHYFDENSKIHVDAKRDNYFLSHNWFVFRFSEFQICQAPLSCCRIVANIIKVVTSNESYINKLQHIPKLERHAMWTFEEAIVKINENFRQGYSNVLNEYSTSKGNDNLF